MERFKVLIAGDSYMSEDQFSRSPWVDIHWSFHLGTEFDVYNRAQPGASNIMINLQVLNGIDEVKPDFIIVGFAFHWRLEFGPAQTNCHWDEISESAKLAYRSYVTEIPEPIEAHRNLVIAKHTIDYASKSAPTVFFLNNLHHAIEQYGSPYFACLKQTQLPFSLLGHDEWQDQDPDRCSFHIRDLWVHREIASKLRKQLFDLASKN